MGLIVQRVPWTRQPEYNAAPNSGPMGMRHIAHHHNVGVTTWSGIPVALGADGAKGVGCIQNTGVSEGVIVGDTSNSMYPRTGEFTYLFVFSVDEIWANAINRSIFGCNNASNHFNIYARSNGTQFTIRTSGSFTLSGSSYVWSPGVKIAVVVSRRSGVVTLHARSANNVITETVASTTDIYNRLGAPFWLLDDPGGSAPPAITGKAFLFAYEPRALDYEALALNPYQIFAP